MKALLNYAQQFTLIFEIVSPEDPHIINEKAGAYLIGARHMEDYALRDESILDSLGFLLDAPRPVWFRTSFKQLKFVASVCEHEGFMVRDGVTHETLMKIKSPYYLTKKFLMRMSKNKANMIWSHHTNWKAIIKDEEFFSVVEHIKNTIPEDTWMGMSEQDRGAIVQRYFDNDGI